MIMLDDGAYEKEWIKSIRRALKSRCRRVKTKMCLVERIK